MTALIRLLMLVVFSVVLLGIGMVLRATRRRASDAPELYAEGYFIGTGLGVGLALGIVLGTVLSLLLQNVGLGIALGPAVGVAVGMGLGVIWEQRNQARIRPLSEAEKRARTVAMVTGAAILLLGMATLLVILAARQFVW